MLRVRKARRRSVCPLCRRLINVGEQVCLPREWDWSHVRCYLGPAHTLPPQHRRKVS